MDIWQRLVEYWKQCGLAIQRGATHAAIRAFEVRYGLPLPADLRRYFLTVDGSSQEMDPGLYRFWPLEEVKPVNHELSDANPDRYAYPGCFIFADHCISCWDYAVRLDHSIEIAGPVYRVTGSNPPGEQMAASFVQFMEMYLASPKNIM